MNIPWRKLGTKAWDLVVQVIRATAPAKGDAEPSPPSVEDRWRDFREPPR